MSKRIISLLLTLAVLVGSVFSMTSCLSAITELINSIPFEEILNTPPLEDDEQEPPSDEDDPENENPLPDNSTDDSTDNSDVSFIPSDDGLDDLVASLDPSYKTLLSTVSIISTFRVRSGYATTSESSAGSGVIYSVDKEAGDAYIITNYHVVYNASSVNASGIATDIKIYLYGQEYSTYAINATYLGGSLTYDVAVLKVENSEVIRNSLALAVSFADSDRVAVMDECFVVGNPEGEGIAVTSGTVSVDSESLVMLGADDYTTVDLRVMRICAAVNGGNSGGGLYDINGGLIGIIVAKKTGEDIDNMGYAIPSTLVKNLAENIIYNCDGDARVTVKKALIGITLTAYTTGLTVDPDSGKLVKRELVEIVEVGISCLMADDIKVGDIILSLTVDGVKKDVTRTHHVIDHMLKARVGSTVTLTVQRGEQIITSTVEIPAGAVTSVK